MDITTACSESYDAVGLKENVGYHFTITENGSNIGIIEIKDTDLVYVESFIYEDRDDMIDVSNCESEDEYAEKVAEIIKTS